MGYDLHITRAENWTESGTSPITLEEWLRYVEGDPEMKMECVAEASLPSGTLRYVSEGLAVWTAYSIKSTKVWFDHRGGEITVKNPDEEVVQKMIEIARQLNANVQGDEGERYPTSPSKPKRSAWRRFFGCR